MREAGECGKLGESKAVVQPSPGMVLGLPQPILTLSLRSFFRKVFTAVPLMWALTAKLLKTQYHTISTGKIDPPSRKTGPPHADPDAGPDIGHLLSAYTKLVICTTR